MKCPNCNETEHEPSAKYCHRCGSNLSRRDKKRKSVLQRRNVDVKSGSYLLTQLGFFSLLYFINITAFTLASSLFIIFGYKGVLDGVLWPKIMFLGLVLFGFVGSIISIFRYYRYKDKDDLLGEPIPFIIDSWFIIVGILAELSCSLGLRFLLIGFVMLLNYFAHILRKKMWKYCK